MIYGWEDFVRTVKHKSRFFFSTISAPNENVPTDHTPSEMLAEIGRAVSDLGLVRSWPVGSQLFRVRNREADAIWPLDATQLGPPSNEKAQAQRMNPAGISYFYLAKERETALAEVVREPHCQAAVALFRLCRDLWLLDLTQFPKFPSIFDRKHRAERELLLFLFAFTRQISEPVKKDGREHIDYVPSQVVSEYFAKIYRMADGNPLDGMAYESAVRPGGINIVLFPPQQKSKSFSGLVEFSGCKLITFGHWMEFFDAIR